MEVCPYQKNATLISMLLRRDLGLGSNVNDAVQAAYRDGYAGKFSQCLAAVGRRALAAERTDAFQSLPPKGVYYAPFLNFPKHTPSVSH